MRRRRPLAVIHPSGRLAGQSAGQSCVPLMVSSLLVGTRSQEPRREIIYSLFPQPATTVGRAGRRPGSSVQMGAANVSVGPVKLVGRLAAGQ